MPQRPAFVLSSKPVRLGLLVLGLLLGLVACQPSDESTGGTAGVTATDQLDIREDMCEKDRDPAGCREQVASLRAKLEEMRKSE